MTSAIYLPLSFAVNAAILFYAFSSTLTPRLGKLWTILIGVGAILVVGLMVGDELRIPSVRASTLALSLILLVLVLFTDKILVKLSAFVIMEVFEVFADLAAWPFGACITGLTDKGDLDRLIESPDGIFIRSFYWAVLAGFVFVYIAAWRKYVRPQRHISGDVFLFGVAMQIFVQAAFLTLLFEAFSRDSIHLGLTLALLGVDTFGLATLSYALVLFRDESAAAAKAAALLSRKSSQQRYMDDLSEYARSIDREREDLYAAVDTLSAVLENGTEEEVERELTSLTNRKGLIPGVYSKSLAVTSLVAAKAAAAQAMGAEFTCETYLDLAPPLSEFDACTILSNLLDNALRALEKVHGRRWIRLRAVRYAGLLNLECSNPCPRSARFESGRRGHGLGVFIVRDTAEKNGGSLYIRAGKEFRAVVSFPDPEAEIRKSPKRPGL